MTIGDLIKYNVDAANGDFYCIQFATERYDLYLDKNNIHTPQFPYWGIYNIRIDNHITGDRVVNKKFLEKIYENPRFN